MEKIILELDASFKEILDNQSNEHPESIMIIESNSFDGGGGIFQSLILLSATTMPFITKIVIEAIRANQHVEIIKDGVTVRGISEKKAVQIIEKLSKNQPVNEN